MTTLPAAFTYDSARRLYCAPDGSTWRAIKTGTGRIVAYLEVFHSRACGFVSVPGVSRFLNA